MAEVAKKAIFLGVRLLHSNKKNQDYRAVTLYTPPFKASNGFTYGGVQEYFTALDATVGDCIRIGAIVRPVLATNPYSRRVDLEGLTVCGESPYTAADFEG